MELPLLFFFFSTQKVVREQIKAQIKAVLVMTCISSVNTSIDF